MPMRRFGRPGLLGLAARTAVVAGTASAVSNGVANSRQRRSQAEYEQQQYEEAQRQAQVDEAARNAAAQYQPPPGTPSASASAAPSGANIAEQLQQLSALMQSGVLSEEEFATAKGKLLS